MNEVAAAATVLTMDVESVTGENSEVPEQSGQHGLKRPLEEIQEQSAHTSGEAERRDDEDSEVKVSTTPQKLSASPSTQHLTLSDSTSTRTRGRQPWMCICRPPSSCSPRARAQRQRPCRKGTAAPLINEVLFDASTAVGKF